MPPRRTPKSTAGKSTSNPKNSDGPPQSTSLLSANSAPEAPTTSTAVTKPPPSSSPLLNEESQPSIVPLEENTSAEKPPRRTVVKRTVKVVKKIVKKKKKVDIKSELSTSVNENESILSNPKPSSSLDVESNGVDSGDVSKTDYTECQLPESSSSLSVEAVKGSDSLIGIENDKDFEVSEGGKDGSLCEQASNFALDGVVGNTGGDDFDECFQANAALLEKGDDIIGDCQKDIGNFECSKGMEDVMEQSVKESECSESRMDGGLKTEDVDDASNECDEREKEQVCSGEVGGSGEERNRYVDGVLPSGEMETLERQRKRKTEIFVGGLDKETKEEDIRKVFEVVGEILDVTVVKDSKTGKGKGFAFVRYASADDAKTALTKFHKVEICGRKCGTSPVEGNDTIFLGNIDKKWKNKDVLKHLQEIGIEKIDKVTVKNDPNNLELNRGFAFLEFETKKDAQTAYHKLQKKDVFGKHMKMKVEWAEPLIEPDEEEILKVKSVYAEYIPTSWDEEKVEDYFKCFGEIENVVLAKNLRTSKRKDFAFINYKARESALACVEGFSRERYDEGSKVNMKVYLAKSIPRVKNASKHPNMEIPKKKQNAALAVLAPHELRNMGKSTITRYEGTRATGKSSTTDQLRNMGKSIGTGYSDTRSVEKSSTSAELVQLLREQASWKPTAASASRAPGFIVQDYQPSPGLKRSSAVLGNEYYSDPRGNPQMRFGSSYPVSSSRPFQGLGIASLPGYKQYGASYPSEGFYRVEEGPSHSQTREQAPYHGAGGLYRRY